MQAWYGTLHGYYHACILGGRRGGGRTIGYVEGKAEIEHLGVFQVSLSAAVWLLCL